MSIRYRNDRPIVEVYDPALGRKAHIRPADFGMDFRDLTGRALDRAARKLEQAALDKHATRERRAETCDAFAARWLTDFPRPAEGSNVHYTERASKFAEDFAGVALRAVQRRAARDWAAANPARVPAVRAMFNDAIDDEACTVNPFANLGIKQGPGRKGIIVLTQTEVDRLAEIAAGVHAPPLGPELAAMIVWGAYTLMRPGEIFDARFSHLHGDTYQLDSQWNAKARKVTEPKHGSSGEIYVPAQARHAVTSKPRRLGDDLMFRTARGRRFNGESLHRAWKEVRAAFAAELPGHHALRRRLAEDPADKLDFYELRHFGASYMLNVLDLEPWVIAQQLRHSDGGGLVTKLYGHPDRKRALSRIRTAYEQASGENVTPLRGVSGDVRGNTAEGSA